MSTEERKLAAIVFTDICGFTELMGSDETKAMALLDQQRALLKPIISNFNGEWLKEIGDGVLISFPSAVKAVTCSLEIQRILAHNSDLTLRIGIHIGDVIKKGGDVFGDGVNIASRLEPLAEPGGICVSERVHEDIKNKPEISTAFQEEQLLKGVDKPIKVYSIFTQMGSAPEQEPITTKQVAGLNMGILGGVGALVLVGIIFFVLGSGSDQPNIDSKSIAVLPFDNYSTNPEDQYFSDGMTEIIIANLAKISDLKVISRTSVMKYKDSEKSINEIGNELGVASILEGSLLRIGDRIRIVGQLVDTKSDNHLWAETYDSNISELFDIQIDVAQKIADALEAKLTKAEKERLIKKPTEDLEAWDYYLKGLDYVKKSGNKENSELAIYFFEKAYEKDPGFSEAYAEAVEIHMWMSWGGADRTERRKAMAKKALDKALELDPDNPDVRVARGYYYYHGFRDYLRALEDFKYAQKVSPGNGIYNEHVAYIQRRLGKLEDAVANLETALKFDPNNSVLMDQIGETYTYLYQYNKAEKFLEKALLQARDVSGYHSGYAYCKLYQGQFEQAKNIINDGLKLLQGDNLLGAKGRISIFERNYHAAFEAYRSLKNPISIGQTQYTPIETRLGIVNRLMGNNKQAQDYLNTSKIILEKALDEFPNDARIYGSYGIVLAYLGEKEEALKAGKMAVSLIPVEKDALIGPGYLITLTKILTIVGENETALENLEFLRSIPAGVDVEILKLDPVWDPLRNEPRFKVLIQEAA